MIDKLNELYSILGEQILSIIPVEWDIAYLLYQTDKKDYEKYISIFYIEKKEKKISKFNNIKNKNDNLDYEYNPLIKDIENTIIEIYNCFDYYKQNLWSQLSFSLESDGEFNIEFIYENEDNIIKNPKEIEEEWVYKKFGYINSSNKK